MRTKKLRLGIVMAAVVAAVGGSALSAAQSATTWAEAGPAAADTSGVQAQTPATESFATKAVFDWT